MMSTHMSGARKQTLLDEDRMNYQNAAAIAPEALQLTPNMHKQLHPHEPHITYARALAA